MDSPMGKIHEVQQCGVALDDHQLGRGRHEQWPRCLEARKFRVLQPPVLPSAAVVPARAPGCDVAVV